MCHTPIPHAPLRVNCLLYPADPVAERPGYPHSPDVAQAARALVAALSKEAPFCNDPRMQTLFDLTGVT